MTDISKCVSGCDKKHQCWRYMAPGSEYQSYMEFKPDESGECKDFWDIKERNA